MRAQDLATRLLETAPQRGAELGAAGGGDRPARPADPPSYIYGDSAAGVFSIYFFIQPGNPQQGAVWIAQAALNFAGGAGFLAASVNFQENGVQRTGWIYQFALGSGDFAIYFPDYDDGSGYYDCAETTLPYTPGQPPAGLANAVPLRRSQS